MRRGDGFNASRGSAQARGPDTRVVLLGARRGRTVELGDLLGEVYQTILAEGTLPTPPV